MSTRQNTPYLLACLLRWRTLIFVTLEKGKTLQTKGLNLAMVAAAIVLSLSACSPVMEATRPDPVDISQLSVGENRLDVVSALGAPTATLKDGDGQSCDVYKLYTHGPGPAMKGAIAVGEAAADVVTLGLTEVVFTPAEAATRNSKHTVTACYGGDMKLASLRESE